jgi:uncharacterized protein (DUF2384 family)
MVSARQIVEVLGGGDGLIHSVKTLADLDAAVHKGPPRAALDHVLAVAAPKSERAKLRNAVVPRASYQRNRRLSPSHSATTERLARITALAQWVWRISIRRRNFSGGPIPSLPAGVRFRPR